jgi:peptide/nickel transport system substrate-binding protein
MALTAAIVVSLFAVSGAAGEAQQTPKRGGTLTVRLLANEPPCLNVLLTICGPFVHDFSEKVLERPFGVGPDFTYEKSLVSRVDFTKRRPFALTYHIRPEARWSDGVPITAQDFKFTLQAIRRHGTQEFRELHAPVRSARAVDHKTLRVVLRPRSASWPDFFGNILPAHALRGSDLTQVWRDRIDDPRTGRPIGSGPFLVERLERGRQLVLRRNPRYWGSHPAYVDRLVLKFVEQLATDPTDELQSGELDVAFGVPLSVVADVRRQPGMRLVAAANPVFEQLAVQLGPSAHPALRNKLVRRALAYGIDRTALAREIWGELDPSHRALDSAVHLAQSRYYEPNWGAYRYRPAESRRLLGQAGCRRGADGVFSCAGERLSLRFVTSAFPSRVLALTLIQTQLRAAGVEVVPVFAPPPAFITQILPQGDFDVALFSWANSPAASWADVYGCGGADNYTGYCQRLVTAHLNQADKLLDDRRRAHVLNRADRGLASDVPTIPLYQFIATVAYDTSVRNFAFVPWNPLWNAENWWLDR